MLKISSGNNKVGKIPSVSLTPIKSCVNCSYCKKDCYALKSYRMYPNVRNAWDSNFDLAKNDLNTFFNELDRYLNKKRPKIFRYHVAGDIISQEYFDNMKNIAVKYPDIKFLAFTKNFTIKYRNIPDNLSIILSIFPGMPIPKINLPKAFMQDGTEKRIKTALECHGNCEYCGLCWELKNLNKNVYFNKH